MVIDKIFLTNFRNYESLELTLNPKVNIFIGKNAAGKTNILESIYFLAITKSHRLINDINMITNNELFSKVKSEIIKADQKLTLEILLNEQGKTYKINKVEEKKVSNYISNLMCLIFTPDDLEIIKGSPAVRRRFLNIEIGQISKSYLKNLNKYNYVLKLRNEYLKNSNKDAAYLEILTDKLIEYGVSIVLERQNFINKINGSIDIIFENVTLSNGLRIEYKPSIPLSDNGIELSAIFKNKFKNIKKRELLLKNTLIGPHRDDFLFYLGAKELNEYGSQGQQRMAIIALKLSEIKIFKDVTNEYPVVLLDDILSELDIEKRTNLLNCIDKDIQVIITTTDLKNIKRNKIRNATIYEVENGKVREN